MTNFHQRLKGGRMKNQVGILIQYNKINLRIQKLLLFCRNSSYFPLPRKLINPVKRLINIKNEDDECFNWCLVRYLNHSIQQQFEILMENSQINPILKV